MPTIVQSRRKLKSRLDAKQDVWRAIPALMGDGSGVVEIPNQPGYVYIRLGDNDLGQAFNNRCPPTDDLAIYVGYDPVVDPDRRIFQVLGVRMADYAGGGSTPVPNVGAHHTTHEFGGGDDVYMDWRRLMGLRVGRPVLLTVTVDQGVIFRGGVWLPVIAQTTPPLTVPGLAAQSYYALIALDSAGVVTIAYGPPVATATLTIANCPVPAAGEIPLAAVRLRGGQTVITDIPSAPDIVDLRFPTYSTSGGIGSISPGTAQYQVVTSGANPYPAAWSTYLLSGTAGGKTTFAVTNTKVLTLTATDDSGITFTGACVLTIPTAGAVTAALLGTANIFTATQTISNATPSLVLTDTTGGAKSLTIAVDANVANLRESSGAAGSLLVLDLANNRVGVGIAAPADMVHVYANANANVSLKFENPNAGAGAAMFFRVTDGTRNAYYGMDGAGAAAARALQAYIYSDSDPGVGLWASSVAGLIRFYTGGGTAAEERMRVTNVGNIQIGGTANRATAQGSARLDLFDGIAPVGALVNGISIYSVAGVPVLMNAAGNALTLSCAGAYTLTVPATGTAALGTGTATRVAIWSGTNTLSDDAGLTFSGTRLTATDLTVTNAPIVSSLTATRVVYAGASKELVGSSTFTYSPTAAIGLAVIRTITDPAASTVNTYNVLIGALTADNAQPLSAGTNDGRVSGAFTYSGVMYGTSSIVRALSGVTVSGTLYADRAVVIVDATSSVANALTVYAQAPSITAGGAITTAFGLYIGAHKVTGVTTGYGIYQAGASDFNYFAGITTTAGGVHVGGTSDPGNDNLLVDGTSTLTGSVLIATTTASTAILAANGGVLSHGTGNLETSTIGHQINQVAGQPIQAFKVTDAAAHAKVWDTLAGTVTLTYRAVNDAYGAAANYMVVTRNAGTYTIASVTFPGTAVVISGTGTITGAFGCNAAAAQTAAHYHAAGTDADKIVHILAALVANGIMVAT